MTHCEDDKCARSTATINGVRTCSCDCDDCADARREDRREAEEQRRIDRAVDEHRAREQPTKARQASAWLAAVVIVLIFGAGVVGGYALRSLGVGWNVVRVDCQPTSGGFNCMAKNESWSVTEVCWDVVIDCSDTRRRSHACSSQLVAGQYESRFVQAPKIPADVEISAIRVENVKVMP